MVTIAQQRLQQNAGELAVRQQGAAIPHQRPQNAGGLGKTQIGTAGISKRANACQGCVKILKGRNHQPADNQQQQHPHDLKKPLQVDANAPAKQRPARSKRLLTSPSTAPRMARGAGIHVRKNKQNRLKPFPQNCNADQAEDAPACGWHSQTEHSRMVPSISRLELPRLASHPQQHPAQHDDGDEAKQIRSAAASPPSPRSARPACSCCSPGAQRHPHHHAADQPGKHPEIHPVVQSLAVRLTQALPAQCQPPAPLQHPPAG
jgi:hypothetical protein